jgi:cytochrome c5
MRFLVVFLFFIGSSWSDTAEQSTKKNSDDSGQKIYERYCVICHRDGIAGAPRFRNEQDWEKRTSGHTIDDLVTAAVKGMNAMPMKGTCYECSEADLKAAIEYMVPQS